MFKNSLKMFLAGLMVVVFAADGWGARETVNGIEWQYVIENGVAKICDSNGRSSSAISVYTQGDITIPSYLGGRPVCKIGDYAFYGCRYLTGISMPDSVVDIGRAAFSSCSSIEQIVIPGAVTNIGMYAFQQCYNLRSVTIPDSVRCIGSSAFRYCSSLSNVSLGAGLCVIEEAAFDSCASIEAFRVSWQNMHYKETGGAVYTKDGRCIVLCPGAATVMPIMDGVTEIAPYAFGGCQILSATIPAGVTKIGDGAFSGCSNISKITIPDGVTELGYHTFWNCENLQCAIFPNSITNIGYYTFLGTAPKLVETRF